MAVLGQIGILLQILNPATDFTNIEYEDGDGTTLYAYMATPPGYDPASSDVYPTALVFHAWNGMGDEPLYFADLLAKEGYIALAPDLYRGVASPSLLIPWNILSVLTAPQDRMDDDVDAAISYLEGLGTMDPDHLVSGPGFCFGGTQALELARRRHVAATVSLYGTSISELTTATSDADWGLLGHEGSPVMGVYGEDDGSPSPEEAEDFREALSARAITHNVTVYPDVSHAFVNPEAHEDGDEQAVRAWDSVVAFLNEVAEGDGIVATPIERLSTLQSRPRAYHPTLSWAVDHATDAMQHKGHGQVYNP